MFHMPMSSPKITRMLGFFAFAALTGPAINARTARIAATINMLLPINFISLLLFLLMANKVKCRRSRNVEIRK
jgi:hypothetical protein